MARKLTIARARQRTVSSLPDRWFWALTLGAVAGDFTDDAEAEAVWLTVEDDYLRLVEVEGYARPAAWWRFSSGLDTWNPFGGNRRRQLEWLAERGRLLGREAEDLAHLRAEKERTPR